MVGRNPELAKDPMVEQNLLLLLVLTPFVSAALAATLPVGSRNAETWLAGLTMVIALAILAVLFPAVAEGGRIIGTFDWASSIGLDLTFRIDGFAWLFMVLVAGIGLLVILYARYYMAPEDPVPRLYSCLLAFAGAMSGLVLSGNIIVLVVFWELTSIVSFLLIGYWFQRQDARDGAKMALVVTATGGLCLMVAMILIGQIVGSYQLDDVLAAGGRITSHPLYPVVLGLFLLGAFTKSAQFPFHFWLPNAMAAPTPVSSYLHSATMVKAGVFILLRFQPALGGTELWFQVVTGAGLITLLLGALVALFKHDLKGLLAYSTISHLGLITALAGIGTPLALIAAIFHIVNHAVFKASLFMAAGIIDHETGTRDMRRLSGLARAMPVTATLAIIASAAMAGVPLLNGFLSKEMFFEATYVWNNGSPLDNAAPYVAVVAGALSAAYSLRFIVTVFFGPEARDLPHEPHEPPVLMRLPVALLVAICLAVGIAPQAMLGGWLESAAIAILGPELPHFSLKIWHGVNPALIMSLIAMTLGGLIYLLPRRWIDGGEEGPWLMRALNFGAAFDWALHMVGKRLPQAGMRYVSASGLQAQLRVMVLMGMAAAWFATGPLDWNIPLPAITSREVVFALMWLIGGACALGAAWQAKYHRFAALILMGAAGLVTCATFVWLSAPDLAVTQLLVEIATTALLLLGLRWLPKRDEEIVGDNNFRPRLRRFREGRLQFGRQGSRLLWRCRQLDRRLLERGQLDYRLFGHRQFDHRFLERRLLGGRWLGRHRLGFGRRVAGRGGRPRRRLLVFELGHHDRRLGHPDADARFRNDRADDDGVRIVGNMHGRHVVLRFGRDERGRGDRQGDAGGPGQRPAAGRFRLSGAPHGGRRPGRRIGKGVAILRSAGPGCRRRPRPQVLEDVLHRAPGAGWAARRISPRHGRHQVERLEHREVRNRPGRGHGPAGTGQHDRIGGQAFDLARYAAAPGDDPPHRVGIDTGRAAAVREQGGDVILGRPVVERIQMHAGRDRASHRSGS